MKAIKSFIMRYPVESSILLMGIFVSISELPLDGWLKQFMEFQRASYASGILLQGGISLMMVILISKLGMMREAGFTPPSQWKSLWLIWPVLIFSLLNGGFELIDGTFKINWGDGFLLTLFVLLYVSVGLIEEILFRGLVLPLMLRKWGGTLSGILKAVILSSMVFGLVHFVNLLVGRRDLLTTGAQIIYGTFFGVFFAACLLRNRTIWPVIFGHFLFDLCGNFNEVTVGHVFSRVEPTVTPQNAVITIALLLPLLLYGLFILRKVKPEDAIGTPVPVQITAAA